MFTSDPMVALREAELLRLNRPRMPEMRLPSSMDMTGRAANWRSEKIALLAQVASADPLVVDSEVPVADLEVDSADPRAVRSEVDSVLPVVDSAVLHAEVLEVVPPMAPLLLLAPISEVLLYRRMTSPTTPLAVVIAARLFTFAT